MALTLSKRGLATELVSGYTWRFPKMLFFFIKRQLKSKDYGTRKKAIEALGKRKGSTVAMLLAGDLANSEESSEVLSGIGKGDSNSVKTLAGAFSSGGWVLKSAAAIALGQTRQVSALTPLLEAATAEQPNWWAIPAVAEALGELGSDTSIQALRSLLDRAVVRLKSYQKDEERLNQIPDYAQRGVVNALRNSEQAITVIRRSLGKLGATVNSIVARRIRRSGHLEMVDPFSGRDDAGSGSRGRKTLCLPR